MQNINPTRMNGKMFTVSVLTAAILLASGCDWVQDRVPDDYWDRNNPGKTQEGGTETTTENHDQQTGSETGSRGSSPNIVEEGGAPQDGGGTTGPDAGTTASGVTFEVPQGWYWMDAEHRTAMKGDPATRPDYQLPEGKIVVWGAKDGTEQEIREEIQHIHAKAQQDCGNQGEYCTEQPFYTESDVGGITIYAAVSEPGYANYRTTVAGFHKNGKNVTLTIYDDIGRWSDLVERVVTTITW